MMRGMTPDKAKSQIDSLMQSGQMSREQFESLKSQAQGICNLLGIK